MDDLTLVARAHWLMCAIEDANKEITHTMLRLCMAASGWRSPPALLFVM